MRMLQLSLFLECVMLKTLTKCYMYNHMVYITTVKVFELEEQLFQQQAVEQELRQAHVAELAEVQQKMRVQMEEEKQNFLQQIRELTRLKEDAYAKVCIWRVQGISEMVQPL